MGSSPITARGAPVAQSVEHVHNEKCIQFSKKGFQQISPNQCPSAPATCNKGNSDCVRQRYTLLGRKTIVYCGVEQSVSSSGSLPEGQWFESTPRNQRSVGVSPFSKMPDSVNTDFVSFNYHRQCWRLQVRVLLAPLGGAKALRKSISNSMWLAANALQEGEVKLTNRISYPMTYKQ